jgi:VIT1/CCC1 family predicted Fe2+/Mn2+ transporter
MPPTGPSGRVPIRWQAGTLLSGRVAQAPAALPPGKGVDPVQDAARGRVERTELGHSKAFVLQVVQPALAGLMDGSVSTLGPLFAAAFATHSPHTALLVGIAASVGAAISMAFAEGLSDDGRLTGRGSPLLRGGAIGVATFVGGIGHALPFLLPTLHTALALAYTVVAVELAAIAAIRHRYFGVRLWLSVAQVVFGGMLVFGAAVLIGSGAG